MSTSPLQRQPADHGYLRVQGRKLVFDDGTVFVPIGLSLLGVTQMEYRDDFLALWGMSPEAWFDTLAAHGVNFLRVHMMVHKGGVNELCAVPELLPAQAELLARNLDWYLAQCQQRGIYVGVNLEHFAEFSNFEQTPYHVSQGGPCTTVREWVTDPRAVELFKRRIDFYNQFSHYRSFALWEITNELWLADSPTAPVGKDQVVVDWLTDLARYVKQVDPVGHPVGTNLFADTEGMDEPAFQAIQGDASIDWIAVHSYGGDYLTQAHHPFVLETGKPILSTETYNLDTDFAKARYCTWQGLALFSTEMEWSSGFLPDREDWDRDLRLGFDGLLVILRAVATTAAQTVEVDDWGNPAPCHVPGAMGSTDGRHLMAYFPADSLPATVRIEDVPAGRYRVRWFDCLTGNLLTDEQQMADESPDLQTPGGETFLYLSPI
jgi:hypothetical protein